MQVRESESVSERELCKRTRVLLKIRRCGVITSQVFLLRLLLYYFNSPPSSSPTSLMKCAPILSVLHCSSVCPFHQRHSLLLDLLLLYFTPSLALSQLAHLERSRNSLARALLTGTKSCPTRAVRQSFLPAVPVSGLFWVWKYKKLIK